MLTRRDVLRSAGVLGGVAAASPLLAGCGGSPDATGPPGQGSGDVALAADVSRYVGGSSARPGVITAVSDFTADLYNQIAAANPGNVVCSPYSVAVALAMARNGAEGQTAVEMDKVLHDTDLQRFNEGMDSLVLLLESRAGVKKREDGSKATISLEVANSLWGQRGEAWQRPFLKVLAKYYGAGMRLVDYKHDAAAARLAINRWTSQQTQGKIAHLIPPMALDPMTRLVLANAIYLKAPWEHPFTKAKTKARPFRLGDGTQITPPTMREKLFTVATSGPDWRAVRLPYAGRQLAMTVVVPTTSLDDLEQTLDADLLKAIIGSTAQAQSLLVSMPRWKFRLTAQLNDALGSLGMPTAFDPSSADFSGMTREEQLYISAVLHEAYIAVDEQGTEAAAATAVVAIALSAEPPPPEFRVDRPFLFVLHDVETATPLFIGRVMDPRTT